MIDYRREWQERHPDRVYRGGVTDCALCNKAIQGRTNDETEALLAEHRDEHGQDWLDFQASLPTWEEVRDAIHAECKADNPQCGCACGCDERIGCACFSSVCTQCYMNDIRGRDPEPGRGACGLAEAGR